MPSVFWDQILHILALKELGLLPHRRHLCSRSQSWTHITAHGNVTRRATDQRHMHQHEIGREVRLALAPAAHTLQCVHTVSAQWHEQACPEDMQQPWCCSYQTPLHWLHGKMLFSFFFFYLFIFVPSKPPGSSHICLYIYMYPRFLGCYFSSGLLIKMK